MSLESSPPPLVSNSNQPINPSSPEEPNSEAHISDVVVGPTFEEKTSVSPNTSISRSNRNRPSRACTLRPPSHLYSPPPVTLRRVKGAKKEPRSPEESPENIGQCSAVVVTPLVDPPSPSQLSRWKLRSMWELASVLNFLHVSFQSCEL